MLFPHHKSTIELAKVVRSVLREQAVARIAPFEEATQTGALWVDSMVARLHQADFVIADISGRNPNVLFELGIAHGLGKPFVLLVSVDENAEFPSDLLGYQYAIYDPTNILALSSKLDRFVKQLLSRLESQP